jgi:hypothetical protein
MRPLCPVSVAAVLTLIELENAVGGALPPETIGIWRRFDPPPPSAAARAPAQAPRTRVR